MEKEHVLWSYYDGNKEFEKVNDKYLPPMDEGENMASQIVTAVNKLVYKYYNDGDVVDNSWTYEDSSCYNDLTSYANWLYYYVPKAKKVFNEYIGNIKNEEDYENMLKDISDTCLDMDFLKEYEDKAKFETIYDCKGIFELEEFENEDDWI